MISIKFLFFYLYLRVIRDITICICLPSNTYKIFLFGIGILFFLSIKNNAEGWFLWLKFSAQSARIATWMLCFLVCGPMFLVLFSGTTFCAGQVSLIHFDQPYLLVEYRGGLLGPPLTLNDWVSIENYFIDHIATVQRVAVAVAFQYPDNVAVGCNYTQEWMLKENILRDRFLTRYSEQHPLGYMPGTILEHLKWKYIMESTAGMEELFDTVNRVPGFFRSGGGMVSTASFFQEGADGLIPFFIHEPNVPFGTPSALHTSSANWESLGQQVTTVGQCTREGSEFFRLPVR